MKRSFSTVSLAIVILAAAGHAAADETLTDRCSVSVVIKVPYSDANKLDGKDIILARSKDMCRLVEGQTSTPAFRGVCQDKPGENSPWTDPIAYSSIKNSDRRFRWICGSTPERSRCEKGTKQVRFRIGPDRLLETKCID